MVRVSILLSGLLAAVAQAAPLERRIAQIIAESTAQWEQACLAAGGAQQCNPISVTAFSTLLAAAGPCEQQDSADAMIDLAKELGNDAEMIRLAQIFAQQPRNTPTALSTPYCQEAPRNPELNGLFQCQFEGADLETFVGNVAVGAPGTVPFGLNALNPLGSCPANPGGPIPDGAQLVDLVSDPGAGAAPAPAPAPQPVAPVNNNAGNNNRNRNRLNRLNNNNNNNNNNNAAAAAAAPAAAPAVAPAAAAPATPASGFQLANAQAAQQLNAQFAGLNANSPCQDGEQACVDNGFAQCVGGQFLITSCGANICAALPLVNSPGTSITCTSLAEAVDRIERTGAVGGLTGQD